MKNTLFVLLAVLQLMLSTFRSHSRIVWLADWSCSPKPACPRWLSWVRKYQLICYDCSVEHSIRAVVIHLLVHLFILFVCFLVLWANFHLAGEDIILHAATFKWHYVLLICFCWVWFCCYITLHVILVSCGLYNVQNLLHVCLKLPSFFLL